MGKIQEFLTGFYEMTFKGKGAFWGVLAAIAFLVLVYIFSEDVKEKLKKKAVCLIIVPVLLAAGFIWMFINACHYIPIPERAADQNVTYTWEQRTKNSANILKYTSDVKDPSTGEVYNQEYEFQLTEKKDDASAILDQFTVVKASSEYVFTDYTLTSKDGKTTLTFYPDGTYRFRVADSDEEEEGTYNYKGEYVTLIKANGEEIQKKLTKSAYLKYTSDLPDPSTVKKYTLEFRIKEMKDSLPAEGTAAVSEEMTIAIESGEAEITFRPDGTYRFLLTESNEEETGTYTYQDKVLTLTIDGAAADAKAITVGKSSTVLKYASGLDNPSSMKPYESQFANIDGIINQCLETEVVEKVPAEYTAASTDGSSTLTFNPDGTYKFSAGSAEETGWYMFRKNVLTMSNSTGSDAFWKNAREHYGLLIFGAIFVAAVVLMFIYNKQIKEFLNKRPLVWLLIPAALLIYFVYVSIGWNIWVSVSDWKEGDMNPSYGWNTDSWKFKASGKEREKSLKLGYTAEKLEVDALEFGIDYQYEVEEKIEKEDDSEEGEKEEETRIVEKLGKEYFSIPVLSFDVATPDQPGADSAEFDSNDGGRGRITFKSDGTFEFSVSSVGYSEEGTFTFKDNKLALVRVIPSGDEGETETKTVNAKNAKDHYTTSFVIPDDIFAAAEGDEAVAVESTVTYTSTDEGRASITLNPDGTYEFKVPEDEYTETGVYSYLITYEDRVMNKLLTVENATGAKAAWKSFASGFSQYAKMFSGMTGEDFWNAVKNTLLLFLIIPFCLLLGMGLALIMDQGLRGTPVFRTLILLPFALSFVVTGLIWQQMYNGNGGILVKFFEMLGITLGINWTSNEMVMVSIMIVMIWQFSGYVAVIFLAAIKNVPTNIINAAKLDGAYMPRIYWKMIIPQLKGATGSCITILAMYALRSFDLIYSLTSYTNPASTTLPIMMYVEAFSKNNYAYAAAIGCFLLALVLVLILPLTYWTNRRKR